MIDRLIRRVATNIKLAVAKPLSAGALIGATVTLTCFVLVAIAPNLKASGGKWNSPTDLWQAFSAGWLAIVAALYLRYSERFRRTFMWAKEQRTRRRSRKLICGLALREFGLDSRSSHSGEKMAQLRQKLLQASSLSVASIVTSQHIDIAANLVLFCEDDPTQMSVVARSTHERGRGSRHKRDGMAAWHCIQTGEVCIFDDVNSDPRCAHLLSQNRNYRTVVAVPVTIGSKAYGAISLDSPIPYLFFGKASDIALQLEPYIALLAMTLRGDEPSEECKYEPGRN